MMCPNIHFCELDRSTTAESSSELKATKRQSTSDSGLSKKRFWSSQHARPHSFHLPSCEIEKTEKESSQRTLPKKKAVKVNTPGRGEFYQKHLRCSLHCHTINETLKNLARSRHTSLRSLDSALPKNHLTEQ